jgi:putative YhdH/YhfP family quinone oxidoreductase
MADTFKALVVEETENGNYVRSIKQRSVDDLPDHEVLIEVHYSSLNYKDALSATGNKGVTQQFPHTPGVDAAGIVAQSSNERFSKGDKVIVTSYDLGQNTAGGFGQYIRVPGDWIVPLPDGLTLRESMMLGTAGFTSCTLKPE